MVIAILSIFLIVVAYLDAISYEVPLWLVMLLAGGLAVNPGSLTDAVMGFLVAIVLIIKRKNLKMGEADAILLPFLIGAFGFWPLIGFAAGQWVARKKGWKQYPLLPWLILASLIGKVVTLL